VAESLAGRVAILDVLGLSQAELDGRADDVVPFVPTAEWVARARAQRPKTLDLVALYQKIWRGAFPQAALGVAERDLFYASYTQTYIQRDVRALARVGDETAFLRFLRAAAARTAQLINYADVARDADVSVKTVKAWISILEASGLVYLLQPYHNNVTNRLIKTPKLYFLDTGLCAFITQWSTPASLEAGAMSGAILETYMLSELLKSYWHCARTAPFYFYRDRDQREVDLVIERDGTLFPVEFKKTASPSLHASANFGALQGLGVPMGEGAVLCLKETDVPLSRGVTAIPIGYL
jgi:uncharacterized protein